MKCQKCARPAVVHLTEILTHTDVNGESKRALEIHLCLHHAVEAGILTPAQKAASVVRAPQAAQGAAGNKIVPAKRKPAPLAVPPKQTATSELPPCPACG